MTRGSIPIGWIIAALIVAAFAGIGAYVATHPSSATTTAMQGYGYRGSHSVNAPQTGITADGSFTEPLIDQIKSMPKEELSSEEINAIMEMREEEKLARDVYLTLYDKWGLPIFQNIARSEQTHTDAVKALIEKYGLDDPVKDDSIGVFTDPKFTKLYNQLVADGSKSIEDALKVGATIEDLDIKDLQDWLAKVDNEDIKFAFCNLMKGSRNHLRAFTSQLERYGGTYEPQFISEAEYNAILSGSVERGLVDCQ